MANQSRARMKRIMEMQIKIMADAKQATAVMTGFQKQMIAGQEKTNKLLESSLKRSQRRIKTSAKKSALDMRKITASAFVGGGKGGINQGMDDFMLQERQMRGVTTGLRHEVGKIRNTLLLFVFATAAVTSAFKEWFQATLQAQAALIGLQAVAVSTGLSFDKLKEVSFEMEEKGFLSLGGGAGALKNLAASNLTMSESVAVLRALTDAAAFNRQGTLSMEEAVLGATQGIKNQNSIMIDNAGITKNVSIMYREYALSIGKTAGSLTEMEKRQAIVNGILREAALFAGNAEKSLSSYQGRLTRFKTQMLSLKRDLGEIIAGPVLDSFEKFVNLSKELGTKEGLGQAFIGQLSEMISMSTTLITSFLGRVVEAFNWMSGAFDTIGTAINDLVKLMSTNFGTFIDIGPLTQSLNEFGDKIIKAALLLTLVMKGQKYFGGLLGGMRKGALESGLEQTRSNALRESIILERKYQVLKKGTNAYAIQEAKINFESATLFRKKLATEKIREVFQKRINQLLRQANRTRVEALELEQKTAQMRQMGFSAVVQQRKSGLKRQGDVYWGIGKTPQKNQVLAVQGAMSDMARKNLSLGQRMIHDTKMLGTTWAGVGMNVKRFFMGYKGQVTAATAMTYTFRNALVATGRAVTTIGTIVGNVVGKLFMWYITARMIYDIFSELFKSHAEDYAKITREANLELKAIKGIDDTFKSIQSTLNARNSVFSIQGGKSYRDIMTATGKTFEAMESNMMGINNQLSVAKLTLEKMAKSPKDFTIKELEEQQETVNELRTEINAMFKDYDKAQDKVNQGIESTIKLTKKWGAQSSTSMGKIFKNTQKYFDDLKKIYAAGDISRVSPITDPFIINTFKLQKKEQNEFFLLKKIAYKKYYEELEKIVISGEKKIAKLQIRAMKLRYAGLQDSLFKQALDIQLATEQGIASVRAEIEQLLSLQSQAISSTALNKWSLAKQESLAIAKQTTNLSELSTKQIGYENVAQGKLKNTLESLNVVLKDEKKFIDEIQKSAGTVDHIITPEVVKNLEEGPKLLLEGLTDIEIKIKEIHTGLKSFTDPISGVLDISLADFEKYKTLINVAKGDMKALGNIKLPDAPKGLLVGKDTITEEQKLINKTKELYKELSTSGDAFFKFAETVLQSGQLMGIFSDTSKETTQSLKILKSSQAAQLSIFRELIGLIGEKGARDFDNMIEKILDVSKETNALNTVLETQKILLKGNSFQFKDLSNSYVDAAGGLKLVGTETLNLEKQLMLSARTLDFQESQLLRYFEKQKKILQVLFDAGKISKDDLEVRLLGMEITKEAIDTSFDLKKPIARMDLLNKTLNKFIERLSVSRREIERFKKALDSVTDTQALDFAKQLEKTFEEMEFIQDLEIKLGRLPSPELVAAPILNLFDGVANTLEEELKKLTETTGRANTFDNFLLDIIGIDNESLNEINDRFKALEDQVTKGYNKTRKVLEAQRDYYKKAVDILESINAPTEFIDYFEEKIAALDDSLFKLGMSFNNFLFVMMGLKKSLTEEKLIEGLRNMVQSLADFSYSLGQLIGDLRLQEQNLLKDRNKAVLEQEALYQKGEITANEKMKRIAQIHVHYGKQIDNVWKQLGTSVLKQVADMGTMVITELAKQVIATKAIAGMTEGAGMFGMLGAAFGAFLPFGALIAGIGLVSTLMSDIPSIDPLEFDTPENELSKFGGTIKAEEVTIHISPTFIIEGNQVFIGSGSVVEYVEEATELMKEGVQQSIDNQEFNFDNVRAVGR